MIMFCMDCVFGCVTGHRLHDWVPCYITEHPDAQLVNLSCPVMQQAKLSGCLTIRVCYLKLLIE